MVSALSLTMVSACSRSTTAYCVDRQAPGLGRTAGGYKIVPDYLCNRGQIDTGSPYYSRYFWYYGGSRSGGYISHGRTYRPSKGKIKSSSGKTLSRGGFGGHGHGGS
ncbi:hypothetical protein K1Y72_14495 [Actinomadura sp. PM05-2]|uniref:Uncharacterized protein n=2 Tax=Actinomadura parmotrematis TaxID=2864039 RepID=A0ABS7FVX8_9ACTN|nr:hypothetical protein [Actinomadura parmotrematis]